MPNESFPTSRIPNQEDDRRVIYNQVRADIRSASGANEEELVAAQEAAEAARAAKNRSPGARGVFRRAAAAAILAATIFLMSGCGDKLTTEEPAPEPEPEPEPAPEPEPEPTGPTTYTGNKILDSKIDGTFTQYDNEGCYRGEKHDDMDVGNPQKILEQFVGDPETATAKEWGLAIETLAFEQNISAASTAAIAGFDEFKGLPYNEIEDAIKNLSDEQKARLIERMKWVNSRTTYELEPGEGIANNQTVLPDKNGDPHSKFDPKDITGKRILVAKTILDKDIELTLSDGSTKKILAGSTIIRRNDVDCGNDEEIIEIKTPNSSVSEKVSIAPLNPERPTPEPTSDDPHHTPKSLDAQNAAADPFTPMKVDPAKANSEAAHEKQEAINRHELYDQAAALAQDAAVSEEVAKAQAATEAAMAAAEKHMAEANAAAEAAAARAAAEEAAKQAVADAETARQQAAAEKAARQQVATDAAEQAPSGGVTAADFLKAAEELNKIGE